MTRVAIPSISFCQTEKLRKAVLEKYPDTRFNEEQRRMTDDELVVFLSDRDAAIMGLENLTAEMLDRLPDLKIISHGGRTGQYRSSYVAQSGNSYGLDRRRQPPIRRRAYDRLLRLCPAAWSPLYAMRNGERPRHQMGRHLSGRVVGLHGCGNVGKDVVRFSWPGTARY